MKGEVGTDVTASAEEIRFRFHCNSEWQEVASHRWRQGRQASKKPFTPKRHARQVLVYVALASIGFVIDSQWSTLAALGVFAVPLVLVAILLPIWVILRTVKFFSRPAEKRLDDGEATVELSIDGLRTNGSLQHKWAAFRNVDLFDDGILLNVDRRRHVWLAYVALEQGSPSDVAAFIEGVGLPCKLIKMRG